jgi:hypothetical protein
MIHSQTTKLPTRSAVGKRGRINAAAFVASVALIAQILSACSNLPTTSAAAQYPDLNDPTPTASVRADELAQLKAELVRIRDEHERVAARQQQAIRPVAAVLDQTSPGVEPAVFFLTAP